jgi:hypothetical protein
MRGNIAAALLSCVVLTSAVGANGPSSCCASKWGHCIIPPPSQCPKCTCPCDECRLCLCPACKVKETYVWIERLLHCSNAQARKTAAGKLGCRWHADFCQTPEVVSALIAALYNDVCWEVRRTAATALRQQNARVPQAILALYIAGKLDPHYLVRERADESLDILLVLQRPCYKEFFKEADKLVGKLRGKYKPGSHDSKTLALLNGVDSEEATAEGTSTAETLPLPSEMTEDDLRGPTNRANEAKGEDKKE